MCLDDALYAQNSYTDSKVMEGDKGWEEETEYIVLGGKWEECGEW